MKTILKPVSMIALALSLAACDQNNGAPKTTQENSATPTAATKNDAEVQNEDTKFYDFAEAYFQTAVDRSPSFQGYLGIKKDTDKWDNLSEAYAKEEHALTQQNLTILKTIDYAALSEKAQLSYTLLKQALERDIFEYQFRDHTYPINTMFGTHTELPTFLINYHQVDTIEDAKSYISRLNKVGAQIDQLIINLQRRQDKGIMPPQFVFPVVIPATKNVVTGAPFTDAETDSPVFADFRKKVAASSIPDEAQAGLIAEAKETLKTSFKAGYDRLIAFLEMQETAATTDDGVWKFPDGEAFYNAMLSRFTTTNLTATEVHQIGLDNVNRIHGEMQEIMAKVGFEGSLQDFFVFMREDKQFYYDDTDEGHTAYMASATAAIDAMREALPNYFGILPKADLVVKRVEPFREKSSGLAFYNAPSQDGSRPGTYYANLVDMAQMSTYQMEALAFHEGLPGHHMQIAIAQELEGVPMFQKFIDFTAFTEGWGLYSEMLGKDMGFYKDPYSDFGRLSMELWRACRLVVDTGLHAKRWTRQQAMDYLTANTPNAPGQIETSINRYIVMPGQATAYMIGKLKITELREWSRAELGQAFDIRDFHDEVLKNGAVPLDILEQNIQKWVAKNKVN